MRRRHCQRWNCHSQATLGGLVIMFVVAMSGCGGSDEVPRKISRDEVSRDGVSGEGAAGDATLVRKSPDGGEAAGSNLDDASNDADLGRSSTSDISLAAKTSTATTKNQVVRGKVLEEREQIERSADDKITRRFVARKYSNKEVVFHGPYVEYYPNGKRFKQGMYVDGKQDGMWGYWHDNGRIAKKGKFVDGEHDGIWIYKTDKGYLRRQESYKQGLKDGLWIVYGRKPDTKIREQNFKDGKLHGPTIEFSEDSGEVRARSEWANGEKHGAEEIWNEDGSKAVYREYKNGKLHGRAVVWAPSGAVRTELEYVDGVRQSK